MKTWSLIHSKNHGQLTYLKIQNQLLVLNLKIYTLNMNLMVMLMYMKQWKTQQIQQVVGCQQITDLIFSIRLVIKRIDF